MNEGELGLLAFYGMFAVLLVAAVLRPSPNPPRQRRPTCGLCCADLERGICTMDPRHVQHGR